MSWYKNLKATCPEVCIGIFWKDEKRWKNNRPVCGAKCRDGHQCKAKAVIDSMTDKPVNGRCRMRGGLSTGPKTEEGRLRVREASRKGMIEYWKKKKMTNEKIGRFD